MLMRQWRLIASVIVPLSLLTGCYERIVEPADVFGEIAQGQTYSPASTMLDDWYAVEVIDTQTFAINEPTSSQYNTSYLVVGDTRAIMFDAGSGERPAGSRTMREVAERYTDHKLITLILSRFHYDHISDAATFDGVTLIDRPEIHANISVLHPGPHRQGLGEWDEQTSRPGRLFVRRDVLLSDYLAAMAQVVDGAVASPVASTMRRHQSRQLVRPWAGEILLP
jgi:hypothetical protein